MKSPLLTSVLFAGPLVAAGLFYVWTHVVAVRLGYELSEAAEENESFL